ncbi:family (UPF0113) family protein [Cryptosporidium felis]|nr:family (UPF0113) family protein [Cryptosporidium felis]
MENEIEENISKIMKTVSPLSNEQKVFLDLGKEGKSVEMDGSKAGIYEYNIAKSITLGKSGSFVEDDDSCLTTTITANELCDSNSVLSVAGVNTSEDIQVEDSRAEEIFDGKDSKRKIEEQSAFDIQPLCMETGVEDLSQSAQSTSRAGRRSSANHEVGPRQLKYNQIGVYWKDKESRVYARFTWATRKYSKSFYVGPNKPYATVRDAEKAAIRFLLINSPLHRRSHLKHFRFSESDEEGEEPYVGSQALKEARRTKGIMLHFPAPESDDEVWSHYNTSNINPATLYGEIIKKMDSNESNPVTMASPITSAREYITAKHKQTAATNCPGQNEAKFPPVGLPGAPVVPENVPSDELFLALMANQIDSERMVERQTPGIYMTNNPSTTATSVSSKRFKPNSKTETLDSTDLGLFPPSNCSTQIGSNTFMDQNVISAANPFIGMDYNTLVALQHAQMANYYIQQQMALATAANLAMSSNPGAGGSYPSSARPNPFIFSNLGTTPALATPEPGKSEDSDVERTLGAGNLKAPGSLQAGSASVKTIAESTLDQHGAIIPGQETKAIPSSNVGLCSALTGAGNYQTDYMAAMAAAYSGWYSPYGYAMPFMGSYAPIVSSIIPSPTILGTQFQNNVAVQAPGASHPQPNPSSAPRLQKQVNNNSGSAESLVNTRAEKEPLSQGAAPTTEQESKQAV